MKKNILKQLQGVNQVLSLLNSWLVQCEEKGIFISRTSNLNSLNVILVKEARGFVISDKYAPFIFINSGDSKTAQLFTLLHELAHLWLDISGVPDHFSFSYKSQKSSEFFCNQTAAEILMPEEKIRTFLTMTDIEKVKEFVEKHSKKFLVSRLSLLVRLKSFSMLSNTVFQTLKDQYGEEYEQIQTRTKNENEKSGKGGPNVNSLKISANGESFTKIVTFSYKEGLISGREASSLLDMKLNRIKEKIIPMLCFAIKGQL